MRRPMRAPTVTAARLAAIVLFTVAWPLPAEALQVDVSIEILSEETETPVQVSSVILRDAAGQIACPRGAALSLFHCLGELEFSDGGAEIRVELIGPPVRVKMVKVRRKPDERFRVQRTVVLYLPTSSTPPTYGGLARAVRLLQEGRAEKARPVFEEAYRALAGGSVTQLTVKAAYNYAAVLAQLCTRQGYATCEEARTLLAEVSQLCASHPNLCQLERIGQGLIDRALADLDRSDRDHADAEIRDLYNAVADLAVKQRHCEAATGFTALVASYEGRRDSWERNRVGQFDLTKYAAIAWLHCTVELRRSEPGGLAFLQSLDKAERATREAVALRAGDADLQYATSILTDLRARATTENSLVTPSPQ